MRQILQSKEKIWKSIQYEPFFQEFVAFHSTDCVDKIPFQNLFHMHHTSQLVSHYIRQLLVIMFVLSRVFGIHHNHLSMKNLFIQKTEFHKTFLLVIDKHQQYMISCPFGYHIFIAGFEDAVFEHVSHPLVLRTIPQRLSPYQLICKPILHHSDVGDNLKKLCNKIRNHKYTKIRLEGTEDEDYLLRLLPLVHVNRIHQNTSDVNTVRKEIRKMYKIFRKESDLLSSKFAREALFLQLLEDWVDILSLYKQDFFDNPDMTMSVIRKVLYQYMIDHKYNHISFKSFDLSRMIVSVYLWCEWYEKLFAHIRLYRIDYRPEKTWIGCLDTIIEEDNFQGLQSGIVLFDLCLKENKIVESVDEEVNERLCKTHPMLRAEYLYNSIIKK
jgi:hypothetical protein